MQWNGIAVDTAERDKHAPALRSRAKRAMRQAKAMGRRLGFKSFNPNSHSHLMMIFSKRLHQDLSELTQAGLAKLDKSALTHLLAIGKPFTRRLARAVLRMRRWHGLLTQHVERLELGKDPVGSTAMVVHPAWKPHGALTGRFGCGSPNLLNVPKHTEQRTSTGKLLQIYPSLRSIYIPRPGKVMVKADWKAQELRGMALRAGATRLIEWFHAEVDVHTKHAEMLYKRKPSKKERTLIKNFVFGSLYGGGAETIYKLLVISIPTISLREVVYLMRWFQRVYPEIQAFANEQARFAQANDYVIEPFSGRRRYFFGTVEPTEAVNFPIQALGAHLLSQAMIRLDSTLDKPHELMLAPVHDELILEGPDPLALAAKLEDAMVQTLTWQGQTMKFSIDTAAGSNWANCNEACVKCKLAAACLSKGRALYKPGDPERKEPWCVNRKL